MTRIPGVGDDPTLAEVVGRDPEREGFEVSFAADESVGPAPSAAARRTG